MNKQEWLNALTTLAPIIGIPILAFVVIFVKSKYFVFFVFCYVIFALILTGCVIVFRNEVFYRGRWLTKREKFFNGCAFIILGAISFIYFRHDVYNFIVNSFMNK